MCGLRTRPRTDYVDPPRFLARTAISVTGAYRLDAAAGRYLVVYTAGRFYWSRQ